jgi:hypothetical protein
MSGFDRGRAAVGRTVERDGPFGSVRSCPLQQRSHPSNLREGKAQGRTCPRRERRTPTRADRRREQLKRKNPEAEPIDPRSTDPSGVRSWFSPLAAVAFCDRGRAKRKGPGAQLLQPGRPIARLKHRDRSFDERHVGPGVRKRDARLSAGVNLRRDNLENPTSAVGQKASKAIPSHA